MFELRRKHFPALAYVYMEPNKLPVDVREELLKLESERAHGAECGFGYLVFTKNVAQDMFNFLKHSEVAMTGPDSDFKDRYQCKLDIKRCEIVTSETRLWTHTCNLFERAIHSSAVASKWMVVGSRMVSKETVRENSDVIMWRANVGVKIRSTS